MHIVLRKGGIYFYKILHNIFAISQTSYSPVHDSQLWCHALNSTAFLETKHFKIISSIILLR